MIHFICPECHASLKVDDEFAGRKGVCIKCKCEFQAPLQSTFVPEKKPQAGSPTAANSPATPGDLPSMVQVASTELMSLVNNYNRLAQNYSKLNRQLGTQLMHVMRTQAEQESRMSDVIARLMMQSPHAVRSPVRLTTDFPVAIESVDHQQPRGTRSDNTRWPRFAAACERHFGRPLKYIDLGCAGGGLVLDFLVRGHCAIGLEGSDFSRRDQRAEWRTIPYNLFTCDISQPFTLTATDTGETFKADVISMWEVLEHIPPDRLPTLFANIRNHLADDGIFVGSVATFDDEVGGVHYHATLEPRPWWEEAMRENGLAFTSEPIFDKFDYCRGIGRDAVDSSYYDETYDTTGVAQRRPGFHVVARRTPLGPKAGQVPPPQGVPKFQK